MKYKIKFSKEIIAEFDNEENASKELKQLENRCDQPIILNNCKDGHRITKLMFESGMTNSIGQSRRLIAQGAVLINGVTVTDMECMLVKNGEYVLQLGGRDILKVIIV